MKYSRSRNWVGLLYGKVITSETHGIELNKFAQAVKLRLVSGICPTSNLGRATDYPDFDVHDFPSSFQASTGLAT
jgi:hypothetical protein